MKVDQKEIDSVTVLAAPKRYEYFVKKVADREEAWGLYKKGWAMLGDKDESPKFPLWPAREYAQLCATGEWAGYEAAPISLETLLDEVLPQLEHEQVQMAVFFTPSGRGVAVAPRQLMDDLRSEAANYDG